MEINDDSFFQEGSVEDLAEIHVSELLKLEEQEAKKILKLYRGVRQELRDRLDSLEKGSFTAQRVRGTLLQVETAIAEMNRVLRDEMRASTNVFAGNGVDDLLIEINKWDKHFTGAIVPINVDPLQVASDTSNFLFNKYESSLLSYSQSLRSKFAFGITEGAIQQVSWGEMVQDISKTFLGEEWKLQQIVRTELHNAYSLGKLNGMIDLAEDEVPDLMKTLWHPMDKRTGEDSKRLNRNNPIVKVDEPFVENSTGKTLTYMAPPNRPNDRAILIPYRKGWK